MTICVNPLFLTYLLGHSLTMLSDHAFPEALLQRAVTYEYEAQLVSDT